MPTLADIFHAYGGKYRERFGSQMSDDQLRAMRDLEACHTASAGEALWRCPGCGKRHFTFLGCGNRHCPSCGGTRAVQWQRKHTALLLPGVIYHLITFTLPEGLRRVVRSHPRELLEILMQASASTLLDVAANKKWLGAMPGLTALLHTWTRQYEYHPHVHFIGTGGGIAPDGQWIEAHRKFLVPVHALSSVFRARFRDTLRELHPQIYAKVKSSVWKQHAWVVHSEPVGSGETTLGYLARYVNRVALSNKAILSATDACITLRYRQSGTNKPRTLRLDPIEFIRRFLQHVLPSGLRKVRYFGLHHSSKRPRLRLIQAAMALQANRPMPEPPTQSEPYRPACPKCQAPMEFERRVQGAKPAYGRGTRQQRGPP
jgi:hypothetical protein